MRACVYACAYFLEIFIIMMYAGAYYRKGELMQNKENYQPQEQQDTIKLASPFRELSMAAEIIQSDRCVTLGHEHEVEVYARYLTYRVQRDLYELCQETGLLLDLRWDEFVLVMRQNKLARLVAVAVVRETLDSFYRCGHYNFDVTEVDFLRDGDLEDEDDDMIHSAMLFSPEEGRGIIEGLLFRGELTQYQRQLDRGRDFSWNQFLDELTLAGPLWNEVLMAFRDALVRLDFKPVWCSEKLGGWLEQAQTPEVPHDE